MNAPYRILLALVGLLAAGIAHATLPIQHWTTSNGARVYFVESHELPMLDISVEFGAGSSRDAASKSGLAAMTLRMMRMGAGDMDENSISEQLADVGAALGNTFDVDRAGYNLRTLSQPQFRDPALAILAKVLTQPAFAAEVLARETQRALSGMREAETKPETVAGRTFSRMIFGTHPYQLRANGELETLPKLTRDDLAAFYAEHYRAEGAVIAMMGDVSREQAQAIAQQLAAGLRPGRGPAPIPSVQRAEKAEEKFIPHGSAQAHILIGGPGMKRGDPDYFPLLVGNYILGGGGFNSRLTMEVREKRGLSYSVYSMFAPFREAGPFQIGLQTRRDQAGQALQVIRDTLRDFIAHGPTESELDGAKQNLIGGFPLRIDTSRKIVEYLAVIGFYELPLDYLDRFTQQIAGVTVAEIKDAFARRVDLTKLATVVVGVEHP